MAKRNTKYNYCAVIPCGGGWAHICMQCNRTDGNRTHEDKVLLKSKPEEHTHCAYCGESLQVQYDARMRHLKNIARRDRDDAMRSLGLVKVKGALGGTYWE